MSVSTVDIHVIVVTHASGGGMDGEVALLMLSVVCRYLSRKRKKNQVRKKKVAKGPSQPCSPTMYTGVKSKTPRPAMKRLTSQASPGPIKMKRVWVPIKK